MAMRIRTLPVTARHRFCTKVAIKVLNIVVVLNILCVILSADGNPRQTRESSQIENLKELMRKQQSKLWKDVAFSKYSPELFTQKNQSTFGFNETKTISSLIWSKPGKSKGKKSLKTTAKSKKEKKHITSSVPAQLGNLKWNSNYGFNSYYTGISSGKSKSTLSEDANDENNVYSSFDVGVKDLPSKDKAGNIEFGNENNGSNRISNSKEVTGGALYTKWSKWSRCNKQ